MNKNKNAFSQELIDSAINVEEFNFTFSPDFILTIIYDENEQYSKFSEKYKTHPTVIKIEELCDEYDTNNIYKILSEIDKELSKLKEEDAFMATSLIFNRFF